MTVSTLAVLSLLLVFLTVTEKRVLSCLLGLVALAVTILLLPLLVLVVLLLFVLLLCAMLWDKVRQEEPVEAAEQQTHL